MREIKSKHKNIFMCVYLLCCVYFSSELSFFKDFSHRVSFANDDEISEIIFLCKGQILLLEKKMTSHVHKLNVHLY